MRPKRFGTSYTLKADTRKMAILKRRHAIYECLYV